MRSFLGCILVAALALFPATPRANAAGSDGSPAKKAADSPSNDPSESAKKPDASAEPAKSSLESEIEELRDLLLTQSEQLQAQSDQLKQQQQKMQLLESQLNKASGAPARLAEAPAPLPAPSSGIPSASIPIPSAATSAATAAAAPQAGNAIPESPLQFRLGSAFFTPIGFMDFTGVFRNHNAGGGIGSNFAALPYDYPTSPTSINLLNHVNEARLSMQNSRLGLRIDALVKGAHVMGYVETDFLGVTSSTTGGNVAVSSNSNTLRSRVYWVDVAKNKWEFLGGQTWSLITPGRTGISPLPGNIFFSQDIDVNYQAGLVWGRIPEFRFVFHPSSKAAIAFALDNQEQYWGGSAGGPKPLLPTGPTVVNGVAGLPGTQLNDGTTTVNAPQLLPDVIAKIALDPSAKFHVEFGGVERQFRVAVSSTTSSFSPVVHQRMSGGGGFVNLNFQLFPGFRVLTNNYWSQAGGRYIFGQVPDMTINPDGSLSPIRTSSDVSGIEFTHKNTFLYAYYGGIYVYRDIGLVNGAEYGYGVDATGAGSNYAGAITQNRTIQEFTIGFNQTFWRDNKYGALNLMGQYSYLTRDPWRVATGPSNAKLNLVFLNLRYTLPGAAPAAAELR
jgi:hypothetical protein